jgi:hypothetical protein
MAKANSKALIGAVLKISRNSMSVIPVAFRERASLKLARLARKPTALQVSTPGAAESLAEANEMSGAKPPTAKIAMATPLT